MGTRADVHVHISKGFHRLFGIFNKNVEGNKSVGGTSKWLHLHLLVSPAYFKELFRNSVPRTREVDQRARSLDTCAQNNS